MNDFDSWNKVARLRQRQIESGLDLTFNEVFVPYFGKLADDLSPTSALEIGCGTGHLALSMIKYCQNLDVIEPATGMYDIACEKLKGSKVKVFNKSLGDYKSSQKYDFIFSHLCVHSIDNLSLFFSAVKELLETSGIFVFSLPHPCFYHIYKKIFSSDFCYMMERKYYIDFYITKDRDNLIKNVLYMHRPLSVYFNELINSGLFIVGFEEIMPPIEIQLKYGDKWSFPRYCTFCCKLI